MWVGVPSRGGVGVPSRGGLELSDQAVPKLQNLWAFKNCMFGVEKRLRIKFTQNLQYTYGELVREFLAIAET